MRTATNCPPHDVLLAFHLGEVADADIDRIAAHLEGCPACERQLSGLDGVSDSLLSAFRHPTGRSWGPFAPAMVTVLRPDRYGPFRIVGPLGTGGMGEVYRAEDEKLGRPVALKIVKPEFAHDAGLRARFTGEARAAARVKHPNVVDIYAVGEDHGVPYLAMELLTGETLETRLRRPEPVSLRFALRVAGQIALGLAAAHDRGLIHRDIKPDNVFLISDQRDITDRGDSFDMRVKLLDFGLARSTDTDPGLTDPGQIVGTPAYMAPEQADGRPVTLRTDLFALGCILYRMLTGRPPFPGDTTLAVLHALASSTPLPPRDLNPRVPPALNSLVLRLLQKDPATRPPSATDVSDVCDHLTSGREPAIGSFAARLVSDARNHRRPRRITFAIVSVAVAAVAAGLIALELNRGPVEVAVTSLKDEPHPGHTTFREAFERAVERGHTVIRVTVDGTIDLTRPLPPVAVPGVSVQGPGADGLTVRAAANEPMRLFHVQAGGELTLDGLTVTGGRAFQGGGIQNDGGRVAVRRCVVTGNASDECGGGLFSSGSLLVDASTFSGNTAAVQGGGLYAGLEGGRQPDEVAVTDSTVSGNRSGSGGGGIHIHALWRARLSRCTIAFNRCVPRNGAPTPSLGCGLSVVDATLLMTNCIVAENYRGLPPTEGGPEDRDDLFFARSEKTRLGGGRNLVGVLRPDLANWPGLPGDVLARTGAVIAPRLGPLRGNVGPTPTHALMPDSPAIDAGDDVDLPGGDQRGLPRNAGRAPDIGAYEFQTGPTVRHE